MTGGQAKYSGRIVRYSFLERVVHWIAGGSYVFLLISGLAFFSPRLYWLATLLGGGPTARSWHPWAGVLFSLAVVWMHRMWSRDMRLTAADRAWSKTLGHYIRNEDDQVAPAGRFNAGQKQLFWLMYFGGLLLLVSGILLWGTESIPWSWRALRSVAILLHVAGALFTIGGFIVHVYMGAFVVDGGWRAITQGYVSEGWAKAHHRLWWNEIAGGAGTKHDSTLLGPTDRTS
ncbi:MAG: formate dehydrogenase subunit gamma [Terriglobia bacterium]